MSGPVWCNHTHQPHPTTQFENIATNKPKYKQDISHQYIIVNQTNEHYKSTVVLFS